MARLKVCGAWIAERHTDYELLDAGCRTRALEPFLIGCKKYTGTDFVATDGVLQCNLEEELPFDTDSFDIVTVLDVLEHLNNPHGALKELMRVARKAVYVALPNMYYIHFRWKFLRGQLSGKYLFPTEPIDDRHRWVLSHDEATAFVDKVAEGCDVSHRMILPERGRTKLVSEPIQRILAAKWPNLFAYGALSQILLDESN